MSYDPYRRRRRSTRLKDYDYAAPGCYFVTICVRGGECLLGEIVDGEMKANEYGRIALESWQQLAGRYEYVALDEFTIMPNHMHGILAYDDVGWGGSQTAHTIDTVPRTAPSADEKVRKPLGRLVGVFKTTSTKRINVLRGTPGATFWQRNYYEHIIRNERSLLAIREYILYNPLRWEADKLHPDALPNPFNTPWQRP